ncbi:hypothetical protein DPMN_120186 [Dreissena polymorpha]|uniref:Uncharacterized protein n=1 Tax=Dreissena polymorpha TaxID=45954 RepID=A0A9D4JNB4_DREPO|nr:hypothetical protein DPMN_120186 [Dreissena polymorpha]
MLTTNNRRQTKGDHKIQVVPGLRRSCDGTMLHDVEPMGWTQMHDGMTMLSCYPVRGLSIARRIDALIVLACDCLALEENRCCASDDDSRRVYSRCSLVAEIAGKTH